MAGQQEKAAKAAEADFGQCEYIPFGADDKIKLSFNLILRWLAVRTAKGAEPGEQDLMKFLMMCKARRLNPFDGDAYLIGYDGKDGPVFSTVVAHQALLKRAETHAEFDGMESGVIVRDGPGIVELVGDFFPHTCQLLGGWATVFFVNRRHPMTKRLKLSTFDKGRSLWKTNPEGMIVKCAEADALRSSFPQLIGGMFLHEEMGGDRVHPYESRPDSLEDRRSEDMPAPFIRNASHRPFVDTKGHPVNGSKAQRYEQDDAAVEATERMRSKPDAFRQEPASEIRPGDRPLAMADVVQAQIFASLLEQCSKVKNVADGVILQKEIAARLAARSISDEQACDLNGALQANIETLP